METIDKTYDSLKTGESAWQLNYTVPCCWLGIRFGESRASWHGSYPIYLCSGKGGGWGDALGCMHAETKRQNIQIKPNHYNSKIVGTKPYNNKICMYLEATINSWFIENFITKYMQTTIIIFGSNQIFIIYLISPFLKGVRLSCKQTSPKDALRWVWLNYSQVILGNIRFWNLQKISNIVQCKNKVW